MSDRSFCFVHADFLMPKPWSIMSLLDAFFDGQPKTGFAFSTFSTDSMAHLMQRAGAFDSVGNARKNGWNKPVPPGFSHLIVTRRKISVAILNVFDGWNEHACDFDPCQCEIKR